MNKKQASTLVNKVFRKGDLALLKKQLSNVKKAMKKEPDGDDLREEWDSLNNKFCNVLFGEGLNGDYHTLATLAEHDEEVEE
jgi:hypothetical protein